MALLKKGGFKMEIEPKIMTQVKKILGEFGNKYLTSEGALKRTNVIEDLDNFDHDLMTKLFKNPLIHKNYVETIAGTEVFKLNQFIEMFEYKGFWEDSYTKYTNKIGLTADGKFIDESADVVLDFPFKDNVLKADMSKDELGKDESVDEPFLNEIIAKPEIDELLEPKIFTNVIKYDQKGEHEISNYSNQDNLVIKGNNLIALCSLRKIYNNKIKLIYLDPPYNTGSDSFKYNDSFSRSAWLTFIKNRVEIATDLISNNGVILIQVSFHQFPYLRVLLDNVLNKGKHIFDMNILVRHPERSLTADKPFNDVMEYTLIYSKNPRFEMPRNLIKKTIDKYDHKVTTIRLDEVIYLGGKKVEVYLPEHVKIEKVDPDANNLHRETIRGSIREKNSSGRFYVTYLEKLREKYPAGTIFKVPDIGKDGIGYRYFELPKSNKIKNGAYYQGMPKNTDVTKKPYANFMNMINEYNHANKEGIFSFRNGKKPEALIKKYIEIFTKENDIVLDFFMGSATTPAVAMKMHRRFIGVEQMDYINTVSVPRLRKVIEGEQGGISKDVNWHGGGSFVYAELMEKNQKYLKNILAAKDVKELNILYKRMKEEADFDFRVDLNKYENNADRKNLSFTEQKRLLVKLLDKNQLYYNFNNIDDADVRGLISDNDYQFNQSFYGKRD